MGMHLKKVAARVCTSSPAAIEHISDAISFDHPRKKGAMMQKANVSHGKT
jgi:hypothetical protein